MVKAYKRTSNLRATSITDGYAGIYVPPLVPDFNKTITITLDQKYNKRPDILAYELYGDAKFWWVFLLYNKNELLDPINDFVTGISISVPTRDFVAGI